MKASGLEVRTNYNIGENFGDMGAPFIFKMP
jgi:hypothetical protein